MSRGIFVCFWVCVYVELRITGEEVKGSWGEEEVFLTAHRNHQIR